jgi:hypothetical protein
MVAVAHEVVNFTAGGTGDCLVHGSCLFRGSGARPCIEVWAV